MMPERRKFVKQKLSRNTCTVPLASSLLSRMSPETSTKELNKRTEPNGFKFLLSIIVFGYLIVVGGCVVFAPSPKITHHFDNLVVMDTPTVPNYEKGLIGQLKICRTFYQYYKDEFDVILIISNITFGSNEYRSLRAKGQMRIVRNEVQGIGVTLQDHGKWFGSNKKLKGVIHLPTKLSLIVGAPLHEIMHLWVANKEVIPSIIKDHWGISSVNGNLGGFDMTTLVRLGGNKFSAAPFFLNSPVLLRSIRPYSELELYLAGLIPPEDVSEVWIAEEGKILMDSDGQFKKDKDGNFIFEATNISIWPIEKIVQKLGPRIPNHLNSQKSFRLAVIAINNSTNPLDEKDMKLLRSVVELFVKQESILDVDSIVIEEPGVTHTWSFDPGQYNFWDATGGRAIMDAEIASARIEID